MLKVKHLETFNFEGAIRGMRNPLNSHHLSDSKDNIFEEQGDYVFKIGNNDLNLMKRLYKAGSDHRKYLRQMMICLDITAPLYLFKELDTYKVGTVANSTSTMHKIMSKEFTLDDFSFDNDEFGELKESSYGDYEIDRLVEFLPKDEIGTCNKLRNAYLNENSKYYKNKGLWRLLIQKLGSSYNQTRTITMNYEVAYNIYHSRKSHKLTEWHELCEVFENELPYFKEIME